MSSLLQLDPANNEAERASAHKNPYPGGGGPSAARVSQSQRPFRSPENFMQKNRLVAGAPEIAHPSENEKYEHQVAFIYAWFFETWERVEANDEKAAREARSELQTLWLNHLSQLLRLALDKKDNIEKQWAGRLLASIFVSIDKHDSKKGKARRKLSKANKAYCEEKARLGKLRADVLLHWKISDVVFRELKAAGGYRNSLLLLREGRVPDWAIAARSQSIPEEYWPTMELPEFSVKSEPRWWEFLWPFIQRKIDVSQMPQLWQKDQSKGPGGIKPRKRYLSDHQRTARGELQTFARWKANGVLY